MAVSISALMRSMASDTYLCLVRLRCLLAIDLIKAEILTAMGLMGARTIADLGPQLARGLPTAAIAKTDT